MTEETAVAPVPPTNETQIQLVRIGTFYDEKNKPYHLFQRVVGDELGERLSFSISKHNRRLDGVGLLYDVVEVAGKDGFSWRLGSAKYKGYWPNKNDRLTWSAEQELRDAHQDADAKHKKAVNDHPLQQAIQPLRDLYKSQIGSNRTQLLAYIVKEITK